MMLWILALLWLAMIVYFGTGKWGRAQTQALIDRLRSHPRLHGLMDRYHGNLRAAFHYVEFGGLTLIVYGLLGGVFGQGGWHDGRAALAGAVSALAALLDELHQLRSGSRQFRRVDYLHSCCGIALALFFLRYVFL